MRLLRDQFKIIEQSYHKSSNPTFYFNEKKFKTTQNKNGDHALGNSILNNNNLHGSYNNYFQNGNISHNTNIFNDDTNDNNSIFKDYQIIISLWDDLGVTENYKAIFENLSKDIDPIMRKDLFENEIASLKKFSELLFVSNLNIP